MGAKLSKFISFIFNPLIMPIYMALLIIVVHPQYFTNEVIHPDVLFLYVFGILFFLPLASLFLMRQLEFIDSFQMENKKQRFVPMIAVGSFWLWSYMMMKEGGQYNTSSYFALGRMILGCIASLFILFPLIFTTNTNWSLVGGGALISLILNIFHTSLYNLTFVLIFAILIIGLLSSAQLSLGKNKNDLMSGFLIGFFGQFFAFRVWDLFM